MPKILLTSRRQEAKLDVKKKSLTLRWPEKLLDALAVKAKQNGTSVQTLITEIVCDRYNLWYSRVGTQTEVNRTVDQIYERWRVPASLREALDKAEHDLGLDVIELEEQ